MASAAKIPLKCDICPKKPRFSDVSHLLTHISSKTHLSNIFKARVRLDIDTEARRLVEDYDQWYAEWSIQDLLAERMNQKGDKTAKPRARATPARTGTGRGRGSASSRTAAALTLAGGSQPAIGGPLPVAGLHPSPFGQGWRNPGALPNPILAMRASRQLASGEILERIDPGLQTHPVLNGHPCPHLPPLQPISQPGYYYPPQTIGRKINGQWGHMTPATFVNAMVESQPGEGAAAYPNAVRRRAAAMTANQRLQQTFRESTKDTATATHISATSSSGLTDDWTMLSVPGAETSADNNGFVNCPDVQLKGDRWPGMTAFDAATAEQKSKRNQKKSDDIYRNLERNSADIADNWGWENVWQTSADGTDMFSPYKAHIITGQPTPSELGSDHDLSRSPSPTKSARILRPRKMARTRASRAADARVEHDLDFNVFPRNRLRIPRIDDDDDDDESVDTFAGRPPRRLPNSAYRRRPYIEQENETSNTLAATTIIKTDADGTESGTSVVLPSTEAIQLPHYSSVIASNPLFNNITPLQTGQHTHSSPFHNAYQQISPLGHSPSNGFSYGSNLIFAHGNMPAFMQPPVQQPSQSTSPFAANSNTMHFFPHLDSSPSRAISYHHIYAGHAAHQQSSGHQNMNTGTDNAFNNGLTTAMNTGLPFGIHKGHSNLSTLHSGLDSDAHAGLNLGTGINNRLNNLAQVASQHPGSDWMGDGGADVTVDEDRTVTAPGSQIGEVERSEEDPVPAVMDDTAATTGQA